MRLLKAFVTHFDVELTRAPHHVRKGCITALRNAGVTSDAIHQRCDISNQVQDRHYDPPEPGEEHNRYDGEYRNLDGVRIRRIAFIGQNRPKEVGVWNSQP